jgi:chromosome segregation ATPase
MSDFKSVKQLCEENPNLNNHILSLTDIIAKLETDKIDLTKRHIELENSLIELRKYYKEFDKFAATIYSPNKSTYKELEDKVKNLETIKQKEIDELKTLNRATEQRIAEYIEDKTSLNREIQQLKQSSLNLTNDVFDLRRKNKLLCSVIDFAVGYISATQPHTDKSPIEVKRWLFKGLK